MKIEFEDFVIEAGANDITLSQVFVYKPGTKLAGQAYTRPIGYFSTMEALFLRLFDLKMAKTKAKTFEALVKEAKQVRKEIVEVAREFGSKWKPMEDR